MKLGSFGFEDTLFLGSNPVVGGNLNPTRTELRDLDRSLQTVSNSLRREASVPDGFFTSTSNSTNPSKIKATPSHDKPVGGEKLPVITTHPVGQKFATINSSKQMLRGIYKLNGDKLEYCFAQPGNDRPSSFNVSAGSKLTLIQLERIDRTVPRTSDHPPAIAPHPKADTDATGDSPT